MHFVKSKHNHQRGSAEGKLIWAIVIFCVGMLIKTEFFNGGVATGMSLYEVKEKLGEPVSKKALPRPR